MKAMKAMKTGPAMPKTGIADCIASAMELSKAECVTLLDSLATIGTKEVKKVGKFVLPGLVMIKTRLKPATKAGKREIFGKVVKVKAMKAKTVVKAFCVSTLKKSI